MLENATRVCGAKFGSMVLVESGTVRRAALYNVPPAFAAMRTNEVWQVHPRSSMATAIRSKQVVQVEEMRSSPVYLERWPMSVQLVELGGARTVVVVPMLRDDEVIGLITVYRQEVRPFGDKQVDLLKNFARQAVIAIENARLLRELRQRTGDLTEALTHQTGSANILRVIASSPTDVKPVLNAIVESACELCGAYDALVRLRDGDGLAFGAHHGPLPVSFESVPISENSTAGLAVIEKKPVHVHDLRSPKVTYSPHAQALAREHGERTILSVPLLRENESIGAIVLRRLEVQPIQRQANQLAADLCRPGRDRDRERAAVQRDEGGAGPADRDGRHSQGDRQYRRDNVQPVIEAIAERAKRLVGAHARVLRVVGDRFELGAFTPVSEEADATLRASFPLSIANNPQFEMAYRGEITEVADTELEMYAYAKIRDIARARGFRSRVLVPLRSDHGTVGAISVHAYRACLFAAHHVQLLQTFADQAVIAIENTRLFEQVQAKTRDLTESLEQQTATSEVLEVISASTGELAPVFQKMLENATRIVARSLA